MLWQVQEIAPRQYELSLVAGSPYPNTQQLAETCRCLSQHGLIIQRMEGCQNTGSEASYIPFKLWVHGSSTPYTTADVAALLAPVDAARR